MIYDEKYYKTNNYENYLNKSERYEKLAIELIEFFDSIKLNFKYKNILDYGCAIGFFLDGLKKNNIEKTYGYDISSWALEQIDKKKHKIISYQEIKENEFEIVFFLDVLEHMTDEQISDILLNLKSKKILVRIPVANKKGEDFFLEVSKKDKTHINCKTKEEWLSFLKKFQFNNYLKINLNNIYDSDGVFCALIFRDSLYE
jgi:ribosomal protein L11 methylase PrmA